MTKENMEKWLEKLLPVAIALFGVFMAQARSEAVLTTKLDNLIMVVKENNEEAKRTVNRVDALEKNITVHDYRLNMLEKK